MKLVMSPKSWCSTIIRNGSCARQACACSHSSRFSIASPIVSGYMCVSRSPSSLAVAAASRGGSELSRRGAELARVGSASAPELASSGTSPGAGGGGWPCFPAMSCSTRQRYPPAASPEPDRSCPYPGCDIGSSGVRRQELLRILQLRNRLSGRNRPHHFRRDNHHQLGVVAADAAWSGTACPAAECCRCPASCERLSRGLVVQQSGDHEALAALQLHFRLHAPRGQGPESCSPGRSPRWRNRASSLPAPPSSWMVPRGVTFGRKLIRMPNSRHMMLIAPSARRAAAPSETGTRRPPESSPACPLIASRFGSASISSRRLLCRACDRRRQVDVAAGAAEC